ncbi:MAG: hypothetical protein WD738_21375 [Pirellulales bacterium]
MINDLAIQRTRFYEEHSPFVTTPEGPVIFADGAVDENSITGLGRLIDPPQDEWEKAKLVARHWQIVADAATEAFEAYKLYLKGTGKREDEWARLYTEEDRLAHLRHLQTQAKRMRAKFLKANREVKAHTPFWLNEREQAEIESAARARQFLDSVESIDL